MPASPLHSLPHWPKNQSTHGDQAFSSGQPQQIHALHSLTQLLPVFTPLMRITSHFHNLMARGRLPLPMPSRTHAQPSARCKPPHHRRPIRHVLRGWHGRTVTQVDGQKVYQLLSYKSDVDLEAPRANANASTTSTDCTVRTNKDTLRSTQRKAMIKGVSPKRNAMIYIAFKSWQ